MRSSCKTIGSSRRRGPIIITQKILEERRARLYMTKKTFSHLFSDLPLVGFSISISKF